MISTIKAFFEGEEKEFEITTDITRNTHCMSREGQITFCNNKDHTIPILLLSLVQKLHRFGEFVFQETGEFRQAKMGEWLLETLRDTDMPTPAFVYGIDHTVDEYIILRKPVE